MAFNPVSAVGTSAIFGIDDIVMKNAYVSGVGAAASVRRDPYKVISVDCKTASALGVTDSTYKYCYDIVLNNTNETGRSNDVIESNLTGFASAILKAQISVSQWTSTAVG